MDKEANLINLSKSFYINEFDYFYYFLILIILCFLWIILCKPNKLNFYLYIVHAIFGSLFLYFSKSFQADSTNFYILGTADICPNLLEKNIFINSGLTYCITGISKLIINNYGFSTGIFSFFGFLGINYFFNFLIKIITSPKERLKIFFFFSIPSISFWTTGVGKDSLIIFFYGLIFNVISNNHLQKTEDKLLPKKKKLVNLAYLAFGLLGAYLTRTYTLYILAISLFFSRLKEVLNIIFNLRSKKSQLFLIPIIVLILFYSNSLIDDILITSSASINSDNFNLITQRALLSKISAMESGGSYVNQTGLLKFIYIICGPFSFRNINFLLESIVGLAFSAIVFGIFKNINKLKNSILKLDKLILFLLSISILEIYKIYTFTFNVGIISRQRIIPFILLFTIFYILKYSHDKKINYPKNA